MIFDVPDDISLCIFSNWLFVKDLIMLEISLDSESRANFVLLMRDPKLIFNNKSDTACLTNLQSNNKLYTWIKTKEIKLSCLSFHKAHGFYFPNISSTLWIKPNKAFLDVSQVTELTFRYIIAIKDKTKFLYIGAMLSIIHNCKNLTKLTFKHSLLCNSLVQSVEPQTLHRLTELHCATIFMLLDTVALQNLADNCRALKQLTLSFATQHNECSVNDTVYSLILNNKYMEVVRLEFALTCNNRILDVIRSNCPNIKQVYIRTSNQEFFQSSDVIKFLNECHSIQELTLALSVCTVLETKKGYVKYSQFTHCQLEVHYHSCDSPLYDLFVKIYKYNPKRFQSTMTINLTLSADSD